jgi:putative heme iron utilization protein
MFSEALFIRLSAVHRQLNLIFFSILDLIPGLLVFAICLLQVLTEVNRSLVAIVLIIDIVELQRVKVLEVLLDCRLSNKPIAPLVVVVKAEVIFFFHQKLAEVDVCTGFINIRGHTDLQGLIKEEIRRDLLLMIALLRR